MGCLIWNASCRPHNCIIKINEIISKSRNLYKWAYFPLLANFGWIPFSVSLHALYGPNQNKCRIYPFHELYLIVECCHSGVISSLTLWLICFCLRIYGILNRRLFYILTSWKIDRFERKFVFQFCFCFNDNE